MPQTRSQAQHLLDIGRAASPFSSEPGQPFVSVPVGHDSHRVMPLRSIAFRNWLVGCFYRETETTPQSSSILTALQLLEARACAPDLPKEPVFTRLAATPGKVFLDLHNSAGHIVEIGAHGFSQTPNLSICFRDSRSLQPLPDPDPKAGPEALDTLRRLINVPVGAQWTRCLTWLISAFSPSQPFPILVLHGPPASGKSTALRMLRSLIDPGTAPTCPLPSSEKELIALAESNWLLAFDHVHHFDPKVSHGLASLSSGTAALIRDHGRERDHVQIFLRRPIALAEAAALAVPPALIDRTIALELPPIAQQDRRCERDLFDQFESERPQILGALCNAVSTALGRIALNEILEMPVTRFADAARWTVAAAPALNLSPTAIAQVFESPANPVANAIEALMNNAPTWSGTAAKLLTSLRQSAPNVTWPNTPKGLSQLLHRTAFENLVIESARISGSERRLVLTRICDASRLFKPQDPSHFRATR